MGMRKIIVLFNFSRDKLFKYRFLRGSFSAISTNFIELLIPAVSFWSKFFFLKATATAVYFSKNGLLPCLPISHVRLFVPFQKPQFVGIVRTQVSFPIFSPTVLPIEVISLINSPAASPIIASHLCSRAGRLLGGKQFLTQSLYLTLQSLHRLFLNYGGEKELVILLVSYFSTIYTVLITNSLTVLSPLYHTGN
jgi:hypothetical protein